MLRDEPRPETHQQDADLDPEQKEIDRHAHDLGHLLDFTSHPRGRPVAQTALAC